MIIKIKYENNLQEKLIIQVENIFPSCLKDALVHEIYNLIEPGKSCGKLAREVLSKQQSENTKELSKYIFERLYPTLFKFSSCTTSDREKMYQKVYNLAINNVFFKKWEEYLMFYGISDKHSNML